MSQLVPPFAASGIDYLSIRLFGGLGSREAGKGGLGGILPNGSFLVFKT